MVPNGPQTDDGLVQLLTPTGQRTAHPDYDPRVAHLDADALRGLYRDMVLIRRFDLEATSLQRQGELGLCAQCQGQEAAQIGSGRALAPQDHVFPAYREHGVAYVRGVDMRRPAAAVPRPRPRRLGPDGAQPPPVDAGHRLAHAARHRLRDGHPARRRGRHRRPGAGPAVVAYFGDGATSQGDVERGDRVRRREQRPGRLLLPEQPVGDLGADREAVARPARRPRGGLRHPVRAGRRQRRAGLLRRHGRGPRAGAQRRRPDVHRGVHLSDGRAHHLGRPDPLPLGPRRSTGASATRSSGCARTWRTAGAPRTSSTRLAAEADALGERIADRGRSLMGRPSAASMFDHVYATPQSVVERERAVVRDVRGVVPERRGATDDEHLTMAKAINLGLRKALEREPQGAAHGRGHRCARRRLPRHRRAAEGLR